MNIERNAFFTSELKIGNNSGIGIDCEVYGPVTIGDGVIIGAGAVVIKNIEPYMVAVGVPAKVVKSRLNKSEGDL